MRIAQVGSVATGLWLMFAPVAAGYTGSFADDLHRTIGPLLVTFGIIAVSKVTRALRWANAPLAAVLALAPVFGGHDDRAEAVAVSAALVVLATLPFAGTSRAAQGGGWRAALHPAG